MEKKSRASRLRFLTPHQDSKLVSIADQTGSFNKEPLGWKRRHKLSLHNQANLRTEDLEDLFE